MKLARPTAGGTSAAAATSIQMTPLQNEEISMNRNDNNWNELQPDLFPEKMKQTKGARTVTTQTKQANEHNKKQDDVRNGHGNEGGCLARRVDSDAMLQAR